MHWIRGSFLVLLGLLSVGCFSSRLVAPHQAYAPLLDHEGQLDVVARAGIMDQADTTAAVQVAYAPTDGFEIAASVDGDWATQGNPMAHLGGGLALGAFSRTDVLRAEVLVGANGGVALGDGTACMTGPASTTGGCMGSTQFTLSATYAQPFVQGLIGFEIPYFELAGGMRLFGYLADVTFTGSDGSVGRDGYERLYIESIFTIRVPVDIVRFEALVALPYGIAGDTTPLPGSVEHGVHPYLVFGIALQFDTMGEPEPLQEPTY